MNLPDNTLRSALCEENWGATFELAPIEAMDYAEWLSTPVSLRDPPTRQGWSEANEVSAVLRQHMESHPEFQRLVLTRNRGNFSPLSIALVHENLERAATNAHRPDTRAIELFLRQAGMLRPVVTATITTNIDDPDQMTDEEIAAAEAKILQTRNIINVED